MPLTGKYEPSQNDRTREQVEIYEATNGVKGGTLNGKPLIVVTFKGAKSGKIRKTPLMRIEHNGTYAVVASNAGAPTHPLWYRNIVADPLVELQDGAVRYEMRAREVFGEEKTNGGSGRTPLIRNSPPTELVLAVIFRCSFWSRSRLRDLRTWANHRANAGMEKGSQTWFAENGETLPGRIR
jgi:F420H(2)-dependent quinone reductase